MTDHRMPTEKRDAILAEHAALRERLDSLQALWRTVGEGPEAVRVLLASLRDFRKELVRHMDSEERAALPELAQVDGFGDERVRALLEEHAEQRAAIAALEAKLVRADSPSSLQAYMDSYAQRLRAEMDAEEEKHLSSKVLHDDLVSKDDYFGG